MSIPELPPEHRTPKAPSRRSRRLGMVGLAAILVAAGAAAIVAANDRTAPSSAVDESATSAPSIAGPVTWRTESHTTVDAIWPQQTLAEVDAAQSRARSGNPAYAWELDAREVALRFLRQQLGWPRTFAPPQFQGQGVRRVVYDASTCLPTITDCISELEQGGARAQITVERLGAGDEGVWAVTEIDDPTLVVNVRPGLQVPDGAPLIGLTLAKEGSPITAGYAYRGSCGARVHAIDLIVASYRVDFTADVSAPGALCPTGASTTSDLPTTGYVFLMTPGRLGGTPFDRRAGGTRLVHFTALPVTFGPPLALASSPRYLRWPSGPERRLGKRHTEVVRVMTNLPDGTRVGEYLFTKDLETPAFEMAEGGFIDLGIANNVCHERNGQLIGTKVTVTLTVAPVYSWPGSCPPPGWAGCAGIPQSPAILAVLGRHFERAAGDQVDAHGPDNWIVARHTYRFPAKTCTAKVVGGDWIKIKLGA